MKKVLYVFLSFAVLHVISCKSSTEKNEYNATEIKIPHSPKSSIKNKETLSSAKPEYPKVDLPDGNEDRPDTSPPETIARKKKSYVYYKPVSIKPTEKPVEKPAETSDKPVETYRDPNLPDKQTAKKSRSGKNFPDLSKKLVKQ